jgi:parallel beta-helix repeat protein
MSNTATSNTQYGFYLSDSISNSLTNNTATSNVLHGFSLDYSSNGNTLTNNTASSNTQSGFYLNSTIVNTLTNNKATSNTEMGFVLSDSSSNTLTNNTATSNTEHGFYLGSSSDNLLTSNKVTNNGGYGISVVSSNNNIFSRNTADQISHTPSILINSSKNPIFYLLEGTLTNISWSDSSITDLDTYTVWQNNNQVKTGIFASTRNFMALPLNDLSDGIYEFFILVNNASGVKITDTVYVTILDAPSPVISSPEDLTFEQGTIGQNISWIVMDPNPATYIIYLDGIEFETGTCSSEVPITIGVDHLPPGVYAFTLVVTNTFDFTMSDTVFVFVTDPPIITTTTTTSITTTTTSPTITNTTIVFPPETTVITTIISDGTTIVQTETATMTITPSETTTSSESGASPGWTFTILLISIGCLFVIHKRRQRLE